MTHPDRPPPRRIRGLFCGSGRSSEFRDGHRMALKAAITWLHAEAASMNDPKARDILNSAAFNLGAIVRQGKDNGQGDEPE